ncbi:uncharacterized protein LOC132940064 [Metopolophium dirhodum]|uniref:uncharacterized protein LOC132940064 n=1 Tax=Metopolophium dirhodum TaxID=44670 RepID=UPI00298FD9FA|nr:uncharacterized protein LOC132940064 [Metopolophium dirhodum]
MNENIPLSAELPLTLQAIDFFRRLKNELLNGQHNQFVRGDMICVGCFKRHVIEANRKMTMPFTQRVLNQAIVPVTAFIHAVINNPRADSSICVEVGVLLEQLIARRILSTDHLFEE